jgi:hypothetical protein
MRHQKPMSTPTKRVSSGGTSEATDWAEKRRQQVERAKAIREERKSMVSGSNSGSTPSLSSLPQPTRQASSFDNTPVGGAGRNAAAASGGGADQGFPSNAGRTPRYQMGNDDDDHGHAYPAAHTAAVQQQVKRAPSPMGHAVATVRALKSRGSDDEDYG